MTDINRPEVLAEVTAVFERYEAAFQSNDMAVLDELFWDDPRVVRFGAAEVNYGAPEVRAYRAAQSGEDHARTLSRITITTFGDSTATAFIEFRRLRSGVQGRQSQTWVRTGDGWRVVAAHVTDLDGAHA